MVCLIEFKNVLVINILSIIRKTRKQKIEQKSKKNLVQKS
jgi:hypothetical protein